MLWLNTRREARLQKMGAFSIWHWLIVFLVVAVPVAVIALARGKLTGPGFTVRFGLALLIGGTMSVLAEAGFPLASFPVLILSVLIFRWTALRLNGMGWSRWWALLCFLGPVGLLLAIVLCAKRGPIDSAVPFGKSNSHDFQM